MIRELVKMIKMEFNTEDLTILQRYFDKIYVRKDDCNESQRQISETFAKWDKRLVMLSHEFNVIKKILWIITSAAVGTLVTTIFNLI